MEEVIDAKSSSNLLNDSNNSLSPTDSESSNDDSSNPSSKHFRKRICLTAQYQYRQLLSGGNEVRPTQDLENEIQNNNEEMQQNNNAIEAVNQTQVLQTLTKSVRKRVKKPDTWECNIRSKAYQAGLSYTNRRGKMVAEKCVQTKKNCSTDCKYECAKKISKDEREEIFLSFYSLSTATEKRHFLLSSTERTSTFRSTKKDYENCVESDSANAQKKSASRRKYSYRYFLNVEGERIQVCKTFYLTTLAISQKPIYTVHNKKNVNTNTPYPDMRGKSEKSIRKPTGDADSARNHIKSFPKVQTHYCGATTKREYLEPDLNISKMYDLYIEECTKNGKDPVKKSRYHQIFSTEFNLGFYSDRCDFCEKITWMKKTYTMSNELKKKY